MELITKEDSYAARRELFRNIWQAAMEIDEKDDIIKKPKVIKTLRLDDMNKFVIGKSKKERIKSLRVVCNKILDFCNRQDADDILLEQMIGEQDFTDKIDTKAKKSKLRRAKKKVRTAKSLCTTCNDNTVVEAKATTSDKENDLIEATRSTPPFPEHVHLSSTSKPLRFNKTSVMRKALVTGYTTTSKVGHLDNKKLVKSSTIRRKFIRKKRVKRKTSSKVETASAVPTGILELANL